MNNNPSERIAANSQLIVDAFHSVKALAESVAEDSEPQMLVSTLYWRAHQRLYRAIFEIIQHEGRMCVVCRDKPAHPMSEFNFCLKCHFDLRDEVLP